jgi:hypothetical protein
MLQVLLVVRNATALRRYLVSLSQFSLIVQIYSLTWMDCQTELIGVHIVMCVFYYVYTYYGGWLVYGLLLFLLHINPIISHVLRA